MSDWRRAALVLFALPLVGCPYSASSPIADASTQPLDARLVGQWRCASAEGKEAMLLRFTAGGAGEMDVDASIADRHNPFRLHAATLGGASVLNVEDRDPDAKDRWSLGRLTFLRPNLVLLELAREEPFRAAPAGAKPADTAAAALARGELFADDCVCIRAEEHRP